MSHLKVYNTLNKQFAKISEVAYSIKQKEDNYISKFKQWLLATEKLLQSFNFKESADIASYRGQIIATEFATNAIYSNSKGNTNAVLQLIEPAKETMINLITPVEEKIRTCETIIKELLNEQLELHHYSWNHGLDYRDFILAVWRTFLKQDTTKERARKVKSLLAQEDILKLISDQIKLIK